MLRSVLREESEEQKGAQEHAGCCVCISLWEGTSHDLKSKVHECITTELCVFFARQSSKNQLACTPLAYLKNRNPNVCVFVCMSMAVCMKQGSQVSSPDLLTEQICMLRSVQRQERGIKRDFRSMLDAVCLSPLGKENRNT